MKEETIVKIKTYFSKQPLVAVVYLYGSQAKGSAKKTSDIDLGMVLKRGGRVEKSFYLPQIVHSQELTERLGRRVEIQDLRACRIDFSHRVISEWKLIYVGDEEKRIEFETEVLRRYFDLRLYFKEYYQNLSQIAKKGELNVRYA